MTTTTAAAAAGVRRTRAVTFGEWLELNRPAIVRWWQTPSKTSAPDPILKLEALFEECFEAGGRHALVALAGRLLEEGGGPAS